jgi:enoyl-CoA hydratase/carnithine racemase
VARDDARFGITAVREGIIPGIGMWRGAPYAGLGRARRLALAAEVVDAATALEWGLVDYVVGADAFETKISEVTDRVLTMAWTSTRLTKKLTNMAFETSFAEVVETYFWTGRAIDRQGEARHRYALGFLILLVRVSFRAGSVAA